MTKMHPAAPAGIDQEPGPERLNALCDGVVSIALTVLALEIKLPEHADAALGDLLLHQLPQLMAFLLSFVVIAAFWLAHHRLTRRVLRTSRGFNLANIGFMLALVSLNFPTAVLARYGSSDPLAVMLYGSVVAATGLMLLLMIHVARREALFDPRLAPSQRPRLAVAAWPTAVFAASVPLALLSPSTAMYLWLAAAVGPVVMLHVEFAGVRAA